MSSKCRRTRGDRQVNKSQAVCIDDLSSRSASLYKLPRSSLELFNGSLHRLLPCCDISRAGVYNSAPPSCRLQRSTVTLRGHAWSEGSFAFVRGHRSKALILQAAIPTRMGKKGTSSPSNSGGNGQGLGGSNAGEDGITGNSGKPYDNNNGATRAIYDRRKLSPQERGRPPGLTIRPRLSPLERVSHTRSCVSATGSDPCQWRLSRANRRLGFPCLQPCAWTVSTCEPVLLKNVRPGRGRWLAK